MLPRLLGCILVLIHLGACAALPKANSRAEAKLLEANATLDSLRADINAFYESLNILLADIRTLGEQPGWYEMAAIIAAGEATPGGEDELLPDGDRQNKFSHWTAEWGDSGEELLFQYQSLADRCSISEARRIALVGRLLAMQAWYLEITFRELAANRQDQAEAAYGTVEALSSTQEELESYPLDPTGLYEAATLR